MLGSSSSHSARFQGHSEWDYWDYDSKNRLAVYVAGAVICLMVALYRHLQPVVDHFAIRRVQQLVQTREEFKHRWMGVGVIQYPSDLITYAELVYQIRPEVIIETGTNYGAWRLSLRL